MRMHPITISTLALTLALGALSAAVAQDSQPTSQPAEAEMAAPAAPASAPSETMTVTGIMPPESHPEIVGIIVCFATLDDSMVGNACTVEGYLIEKTEDSVTVADDHNHVATLPISSSTAGLTPGDFVRGTGQITAGDDGATVELGSMYHVVLAMGHGDARTPHASSHIDPATIEPVPY